MIEIVSGHLDSHSSIHAVLLATSLISFAFSVTQGVLEMVSPDKHFHIESKDYNLFGHGGMLFWFTSSIVFSLVRHAPMPWGSISVDNNVSWNSLPLLIYEFLGKVFS